MKLIELLAPERILLGVEAELVRSVAVELAHAVIVSGVATDPDRLEALLAESLPSEAVTVGQRAFLLHFRTEAVEGITAALGVTAAPVHREHDASKEARIVVLVLAPPGEGRAFLSVLATFARALGDEDVVSALVEAGDAEDVLAIEALAAIEVSGDLLVRDILVPHAVFAKPDTTLVQARDLMVRHGLLALPVVSEEREVLGIVTYRELLQQLLSGLAKRKSGEFGDSSEADMEARRNKPVKQVMDRSVLCITEDQLLSDVATVMVDKNLGHVPVVREGALVGMLTREHIVGRVF